MVASNPVEPPPSRPASLHVFRPSPSCRRCCWRCSSPCLHPPPAAPHRSRRSSCWARPTPCRCASIRRSSSANSKTYFLESPEVTASAPAATSSKSLVFERRRLLFGAITGSDIRDRYGNYFTFFWRALARPTSPCGWNTASKRLGSLIQAREVNYPDAKGSYITRFQINGDDYLEQGRVSAWRVLLIENHHTIVALGQSYLWR